MPLATATNFVCGLYVLPIYEFLTVELNQLFVLYIFSPLLIKYLSSPIEALIIISRARYALEKRFRNNTH